METITYTRPSGAEITVSDNAANRAYAAENGWVEAGTKKEKPVKKEKAKNA